MIIRKGEVERGTDGTRFSPSSASQAIQCFSSMHLPTLRLRSQTKHIENLEEAAATWAIIGDQRPHWLLDPASLAVVAERRLIRADALVHSLTDKA